MVVASAEYSAGKEAPDLVSVLMPVYKPDIGLLEMAVQSILGQDHDRLELVVVEDPSPDTAEEYFRGLGDARIRYTLNSRRTSLTEQLNKGIGLCRGEYVARMDADDISAPGRISRQLAFLVENPDASVVGSNIELIDGQGNPIGTRVYPETHEQVAGEICSYCPMPHPAVMFRKSAVVAAGGYTAPAPIEDYDLWSRMFLAGRRFHNIQETLLKYRVHTQAGKMRSLKEQLKRTIELKERYFRGVKGLWTPRHALRHLGERALMHMPAWLVLKLFLFFTAERGA